MPGVQLDAAMLQQMQLGPFSRENEGTDSTAYIMPRFVHHLDDGARYTLREFFAEAFANMEADLQRHIDVLEIGTSWVSHYDDGAYTFNRLVGLGMNELELQRNGFLTEYYVQDLNESPVLSQFADCSFDAVTCTSSIEYFTRPVELMRELLRVLKPGGKLFVVFSNRVFTPSKAIAGWLVTTEDRERADIVGAYISQAAPRAADISNAGEDAHTFSAPEWLDLSPFPGHSDSLNVVWASKVATV